MAALEERVKSVLAAEGVRAPHLEASLDLRYRGQSYELSVPLSMESPDPTPAAASVRQAVEKFHAAHAARYGFAMPAETVEIVTVRLRGTGSGAELNLPQEPLGPPDPLAARVGTKPVWFTAAGAEESVCYDRTLLRPGHRFNGPAVVFQFDTTTVVAPGWSAKVDEHHNLWLARATS